MKRIHVIFLCLIGLSFQSCDSIISKKKTDVNSQSLNDRLYEMIDNGYRMVRCARADSAHVYLESARIQAESAEKPDSATLGRIYNGLGLYYIQLMDDLPSGIDAFSIACKQVAGKPEAEKELDRYLINIAMAYGMGNNENAGLRYAEEAYRKGLEQNDSSVIHDSALTLAELKLKSKDIAEGRKYIDIARQYQRNIPNDHRITMLIAEGLLKETEADYKTAESEYTLATEVAEAPVFLRLKSLLLLASLKSRNGMPQDAINVLNQGLRIAGHNKVRTYLPEIFTMLAECHMRLGHRNAALNLMFYYKTYSDSTQTLMKETAMQRLQLNNEIMLNKFTIERQRAHIQKREKDITIISACGILLVAALAFMLILFYKKRRMYAIIVRQNKEYAKHETYLNRTIAHLQSQILAQTQDRQASGNTMPAFKIEDIMTRLAILLTDESIISNNNLTLNSMAEMLNTNRTYLSKAIKEATGDSFPSLVRSFRVKKAIRLMEENKDASLVEVYEKSGFTSRSSFYSAFKYEIGMSPSVYKSLLHEDN